MFFTSSWSRAWATWFRGRYAWWFEGAPGSDCSLLTQMGLHFLIPNDLWSFNWINLRIPLCKSTCYLQHFLVSWSIVAYYEPIRFTTSHLPCTIARGIERRQQNSIVSPECNILTRPLLCFWSQSFPVGGTAATCCHIFQFMPRSLIYTYYLRDQRDLQPPRNNKRREGRKEGK